LRIKDPYPSEGTGWAQNNHAMEWVDIQAGEGVTIDITNRTMTISADTSTEYEGENLIDITDDTVSISMQGAE
jgi:hypothetical protein